MSEEAKVGVENVKDILVAVNELGLEILKLAKDGLQLSDAVALVSHISSNDELKAKLFAAYNHASEVAGELKDIDLAEGVELVVVQAQYVPKILEALKK